MKFSEFSCQNKQVTTYNSIYRKQLVPTFKTTLPVSNTSWNDSWYVNWGVLLSSSHNIETEAFICFGQLHNPWVGMPFTSCKGSNCGFSSCWGSYIRWSTHFNSLVDMFIDFTDGSQEITLQHFMQSGQFSGWNFPACKEKSMSIFYVLWAKELASQKSRETSCTKFPAIFGFRVAAPLKKIGTYFSSAFPVIQQLYWHLKK